MLVNKEIQIIDNFLNEMRKPPGDCHGKTFDTPPDAYITKELLTKFLVYYKDKISTIEEKNLDEYKRQHEKYWCEKNRVA